ncbi:MAG: methylmalonyl Co-A mutase-associated GTPase MeaB [Desulfobacterales bacterium]|nr:methylmalonyl Co-A mutase-associated GTPase MeaB [Desulfobacterales bacterium]MDJ0874518.1 methylmalonyl Co-A mutase-associated GTPase MeaB [Desulfobacterales bacterium]
MTRIDTDQYVAGVLDGNRRLLSKTITLIESALDNHKQTAREVVRRLLPKSGRAVRLGITGVPGVGKSTFIESLGMYLIGRGHKVAVLAVDPSSRRSGGSIMADKTRMEQLAVQAEAYIRPSPSGGTLGGVARKTRETMIACEAAGFDVMIVETVGVGQSETTVASMVDFFLVLMLAGAGDELQGIKKGVLELADAIAITKADGDNIDKAQRARQAYEYALHLLAPASPDWQPPVLTCSALAMEGVDRIWETVRAHREIIAASGALMANRRQQALAWLQDLLDDGLRERFLRHPGIQEQLPRYQREVVDGRISPTAAADALLFLLDNPKPL